MRLRAFPYFLKPFQSKIIEIEMIKTIETREIMNTYLLLNSEIKILRLKNEDPSSLPLRL